MDWHTFITTLTATGFASGAFVFLAKILSKHLLSMDLECFKAELKATNEKELERFQADLRIATFQHETTFATLHEKRAEAIAELYANLVDAHEAIRNYAVWGSEEPTNRIGTALSKFFAFESYFEPRKIYFQKSLCDRIEQLIIKFRHLHYFGAQKASGVRLETEDLAKRFMEVDQPVLAVRAILGIESSPSNSQS